MVKFNQINMEQMFLFFVSTKRMHIDSFAQKAFNRCPPVLQKQFWIFKRDIGKNQKSGIVLWSNSIKSTWNKCFFSSFPQKGCILIVSLRRLSIGEKAFNRFPPVLQKQFWTYKRDIGKKIENQGLFYGQIQSNQHEILCFFSSFPQKGCILIISFRMLSIGAPQYSRSLFGPMKEILEKIENQGLFFGQI